MFYKCAFVVFKHEPVAYVTVRQAVDMRFDGRRLKVDIDHSRTVKEWLLNHLDGQIKLNAAKRDCYVRIC